MLASERRLETFARVIRRERNRSENSPDYPRGKRARYGKETSEKDDQGAPAVALDMPDTFGRFQDPPVRPSPGGSRSGKCDDGGNEGRAGEDAGGTGTSSREGTAHLVDGDFSGKEGSGASPQAGDAVAAGDQDPAELGAVLAAGTRPDGEIRVAAGSDPDAGAIEDPTEHAADLAVGNPSGWENESGCGW